MLVPVARLDELKEAASQFVERESDPWRVSVLSAEDIYDTLKRLTRFNEQSSGAFIIDSLEVKANTVSKIENTVDALPAGVTAYFEVGLGQNFAELIATLAIDRQHAKIRTGGVKPDDFPRFARHHSVCSDVSRRQRAVQGDGRAASSDTLLSAADIRRRRAERHDARLSEYVPDDRVLPAKAISPTRWRS